MPAPNLLARLVAAARLREWWTYKFAPLLALAYATALHQGAALRPLGPRLLALLAALALGATYVSLLNDWTDRADDAAAGKPNRLARASAGQFGALLGGCLLLGLLAAIWLTRSAGPLAAGCYAAAWLAYAAYSGPPLRLKARGLGGVLADAAGAHLFPHLLVASAVAAWTAGSPLPWPWLLTVGGWALLSGIRGILWHQLADADADRRVGVGTLVVRQGPAAARRLARWVLPAEALALALLLAQGSGWLPALALLAYAGLALARRRLWGTRLVAAEPGPGHHLLLNEFYEAFWPLALLATAVARHPADLPVLLLHLLLFGVAAWPALHDAAAIARAATHALRRHP